MVTITLVSYLAELIGTFIFLLGILMSNGQPLVIGGVLAIVIYLTEGISGGHINPAVSWGMYMRDQLSGQELAGYMISQILGATGAVTAYRYLRKPR